MKQITIKTNFTGDGYAEQHIQSVLFKKFRWICGWGGVDAVNWRLAPEQRSVTVETEGEGENLIKVAQTTANEIQAFLDDKEKEAEIISAALKLALARGDLEGTLKLGAMGGVVTNAKKWAQEEGCQNELYALAELVPNGFMKKIFRWVGPGGGNSEVVRFIYE